MAFDFRSEYIDAHAPANVLVWDGWHALLAHDLLTRTTCTSFLSLANHM
jgi:hypothetical protein